MASIADVLNSYQLKPGNTIVVDAGTYVLSNNILLTAADSGIIIEGYSNSSYPNLSTVLNRGNTSSGSYVIQMAGATGVTLEDLQLTGGQYGLYAANTANSTDLIVSNCTFFDNTSADAFLDTGNTGARSKAIPCTTRPISAQYGIYVNAAGLIVSGTTVHNFFNGEGIYWTGANSTITDNTAYNNYYGIYSYSSGSMVSGNTAYGNNYGIFLSNQSGAAATISDNTVYGNSYVGINTSGAVVTDNTVYNQTTGTGISLSSGQATDNIVYGNSVGINATGGLVNDNQVYDNSSAGIDAYYTVTIEGNHIYANLDGVNLLTYYGYSSTVSNNLLEGNTAVGILDQSGSSSSVQEIVNNTIYQETGNAIQVNSGTTNAHLSNNILWAQAGYDLAVAADSQVGFQSDYNLFYTTAAGEFGSWQGQDLLTQPQWYYETGNDVHSQFANPQFVNISGDDFQLQSTSPAVAMGDPSSSYFEQPTPNEGRIDQGAYGNTPQATTTAAQVVQVLSPSGLEKYPVGQQVTINWQSAGLTTQQPLLLVDAGGGQVNNFVPDTYQSSTNDYAAINFSNVVDTSGVVAPAPQAVYQSYAQASYGVGNTLSYSLPVPDGTYTIQLDFVEPYQYESVGNRVFDIQLQGSTVQSSYDILKAAGAPFKATALNFTVTASGGTGINLNLVNDTYTGAVLSGIEVFAPNSNGVANPTVNLQYSPDSGTTWSTIVTNLTMDRFGRGSYTWSIPTTLASGNQYLIRAVSNDGTNPTGASPQAFQITNNGHNYYVNDGSMTGDVYTTAPGNNANSGKSPDHPMANLAALLAAYTFVPGDTIYVDNGTYNLLRNVELTAQDSGVTIVGPTSGTAVLNRGNLSRNVFEMQGATNVTINGLTITGGDDGIYAASYAGSTGLTVENSTITGNNTSGDGIDLEVSNDGATLSGNSISGQYYGIYIASSQDTIPGNTVYNTGYVGIIVSGSSENVTGNTVYYNGSMGIAVYYGTTPDTISGNTVYGDPTGIYVYGYYFSNNVTVSGNTVYNNSSYGINASYAIVTGNTVYGQLASNAIGIQGYYSEISDNVVYTNVTGIYAQNGSVDGNRVYNNSAAGINAFGSTTIQDNEVYSNGTGINLSNPYGYEGFSGTVANNLLEGNTLAGIHDDAGQGTTAQELANNTIYQQTGNAIQIDGGTIDAQLSNNILWALAGYDISVAADSQTGYQSDYNDLYKGTNANAHIGLWNGTTLGDLPSWQTASGGDTHSISANPDFVDPAGADNVLGYTLVNGAFRDGGPDDNFELDAGSPAINSGNSWTVPATDLLGQPQHDDPGTQNAGSPDYSAAVQSSSQFTAGGVSQNLQATRLLPQPHPAVRVQLLRHQLYPGAGVHGGILAICLCGQHWIRRRSK